MTLTLYGRTSARKKTTKEKSRQGGGAQLERGRERMLHEKTGIPYLGEKGTEKKT